MFEIKRVNLLFILPELSDACFFLFCQSYPLAIGKSRGITDFAVNKITNIMS